MQNGEYSYRTPINLVVPAFITIWSTGWIAGSLSPFKLGRGPHPYVPTWQEALAVRVFTIPLGILVLAGAGRLYLSWLNEKIVVQDDELLWYDWQGKLKVQARLHEVTRLDDSTRMMGRIITTQGEIPLPLAGNFSQLYSDLRHLRDARAYNERPGAADQNGNGGDSLGEPL